MAKRSMRLSFIISAPSQRPQLGFEKSARRATIPDDKRRAPLATAVTARNGYLRRRGVTQIRAGTIAASASSLELQAWSRSKQKRF